MSKFSDNPDRKIFIKQENFENWVCKDYKTFYMTIRKQVHSYDNKCNRDETKYILYMSSSEVMENIETPEEAMQMGYARAGVLFNDRINSSPV